MSGQAGQTRHTPSLPKSERRNSFIQRHLPFASPYKKATSASDYRPADRPRCAAGKEKPRSRGVKSGRKRPNRTNPLYFARLGGRIMTGAPYPRSWQKCHLTRRFCLVYNEDGGKCRDRISFPACPVEANTPSGPSNTHSRSPNREACSRPPLRGCATLRPTQRTIQ
jgi:hypothetical protein